MYRPPHGPTCGRVYLLTAVYVRCIQVWTLTRLFTCPRSIYLSLGFSVQGRKCPGVLRSRFFEVLFAVVVSSLHCRCTWGRQSLLSCLLLFFFFLRSSFSFSLSPFVLSRLTSLSLCLGCACACRCLSAITSIAFSKDNTHLLTASFDTTARCVPLSGESLFPLFSFFSREGSASLSLSLACLKYSRPL